MGVVEGLSGAPVDRLSRNLRNIDFNLLELLVSPVDDLLQLEFVSESLGNAASSMEFLGLNVLVLRNEISNVEETTAHFDQSLSVFTNIDVYSHRTELVDSGRLSDHKNLHFLTQVDVLIVFADSFIDIIVCDRDVGSHQDLAAVVAVFPVFQIFLEAIHYIFLFIQNSMPFIHFSLQLAIDFLLAFDDGIPFFDSDLLALVVLLQSLQFCSELLDLRFQFLIFVCFFLDNLNFNIDQLFEFSEIFGQFEDLLASTIALPVFINSLKNISESIIFGHEGVKMVFFFGSLELFGWNQIIVFLATIL